LKLAEFYQNKISSHQAIFYKRLLYLTSMGRIPGSKNNAKKKKVYKKAIKTWCRPRDIDQVQDDIIKETKDQKKMEFEFDDDLPGCGQFYCTPCARHFMSQVYLDTHLTSRPHKRRMKDIQQEQYSQAEADRGSGKTKEILPPAHPVE
jgi:bud site selection protein 20